MLARCFLNLVSLVFKGASFINLWLKSLRKKRYQDALIVSVDNLSFGGTGKTPLVIAIGTALHEAGIKFAVVSRGYRSQYEKDGILVQADHRVEEVGDEVLLLKKRFPDHDIFVGRDRQRSIREAIGKGALAIILDDGFQSANIAKDIKIMLYNPAHPYYYLRNFKFLMKQEDHILSYHQPDRTKGGNHSVETQHLASHFSANYWFELESFRDAAGSIVDVKNARLFGFSAVGDNLRFKNDLARFNLVGFKGYKDHFDFTQREIAALNRSRIEQAADHLVCTEKDFVKLMTFNLSAIPLIYARNVIKFDFDLTGNILKHAEKKRKDGR